MRPPILITDRTTDRPAFWLFWPDSEKVAPLSAILSGTRIRLAELVGDLIDEAETKEAVRSILANFDPALLKWATPAEYARLLAKVARISAERVAHAGK